jgi:hypothetical protein
MRNDGDGSSASLESLAAAVAAAVESEAFRPPAPRATSSRRALRLAQTRITLVFDALAVVAGVRSGAMLDYCPGLEPEAAASLAAAASEKFASAFPASADDDGDTSPGDASSVVIAAHLDGCCYLLNSRLLGREPAAPPPPLASKFEPNSSSFPSSSGAFSATAPLQIVFRGDPLCARWGESESEGRELAEALAPLAAAVKAVAARKSKRESSLSSSSFVFLDLDQMTSLPTAPALNAFLLGYPVAYSVGDREEAALASRALRSGGGSETSTLALVTLTVRALSPPSLSPSPSVASARAKLCSFSIPLHLWEELTTRRSEGEEEGEEEDDAEEEGDKKEGNRDTFVSLWVESVRASAVCRNSNSKITNSPLACLFRGEGLEASVEFVDSGGVTM